MSEHKKYRKSDKENYKQIEEKAKKLETLINLSNNIREKEHRSPITFNDFLYIASQKPGIVFRDIFQLFYDMLHYYVPEGIDEYASSSNSIGFKNYDCTDLFVNGCDTPFFADRLFANRIMNLANSFKKGTLKNHIFLFEGPPGSGKSTFLKNLLFKMEEFSHIKEGTMYQIYWKLDIEKLGGIQSIDRRLDGIIKTENLNSKDKKTLKSSLGKMKYSQKYVEFACPNHDHPILLIPKTLRKKFLDELITDKKFKEKLYHSREYEWIFRENPCSICTSIYNNVLDITKEPIEIFDMIRVRKVLFSKQFGEGITVYNPGDMPTNKDIINPTIQNSINDLFRNDEVRFVYSSLAKTNNGIYALMDLKEHNVSRLKNLHSIISDGIHKVDLFEENIKSIFMGLINPEDKTHFAGIKSFEDRVIAVRVPYVLDYNTEVEIYRNRFGHHIDNLFLPGVLENIARVVISTRMEKKSKAIQDWLSNPLKYRKYMDKDYLLLKMDIYTGKIPKWLSEEDIKKFGREERERIISLAEKEGESGISGRMSVSLLNNFMNIYSNKDKLITMNEVLSYFGDSKTNDSIPEGFLDSLVELYDYNILQQMKESLYYYNKKQISDDIKNYLYAVNFDIGEKHKAIYTNDIIEITEDFFKNFETIILGVTSISTNRIKMRKEVQREYIESTLSQEIRIDGKKIEDTKQFEDLFEKYTRNLKENVLTSYSSNTNFRRALQDYNSPGFKSYDKRLQKDIERMIVNLMDKFNYNMIGAVQISLYILDKKLYTKY